MGYFELKKMITDVSTIKSEIGEFQGLLELAKESRKFKSIQAKLDKDGQLSTQNISKNGISKTDFEWFISIIASGCISVVVLDGETVIEKMECGEYVIETMHKPWETKVTTIKKV